MQEMAARAMDEAARKTYPAASTREMTTANMTATTKVTDAAVPGESTDVSSAADVAPAAMASATLRPKRYRQQKREHRNRYQPAHAPIV